MQDERRAYLARLVEGAQAGDRDAMEEIATEATRMAGRLVGAYSGRIEDEGDIVQAVVIDVFLGIRKLRDPGSFGPWLASIARRRTQDFLRRKHRELERRRIEDGIAVEDLPDARSATGFLAPLFEDHLHAIEKEVRALPPKYRRVLLLTLQEGWDLPEVAADLSLPENTVKTQYHRGIKLLKGRLRRTP